MLRYGEGSVFLSRTGVTIPEGWKTKWFKKLLKELCRRPTP
jgi:hypothetical protein